MFCVILVYAKSTTPARLNEVACSVQRDNKTGLYFRLAYCPVAKYKQKENLLRDTYIRSRLPTVIIVQHST